MDNRELSNISQRNPIETVKGTEPEYSKKGIYNGTNPSKSFGSESVHDVDFHKG